MRAWTRWQDWANVVLGVILFILAFVFAGANTGHGSAFWTGIVIGVLLFLVGLYLLSSPVNVGAEWVQLILAILLFIAPWVLGFVALSSMAWTCWIIGVLAFICAGWVLLNQRSSMTRPTA